MTYPNYARAYHHASAQSASPGKLVLMLFDGALRFLDNANAGFQETNFMRGAEQIHNNLIKAQAILTELQATLNLERGGEFGAMMYRLYGYMQDQLREANLRKEQRLIGGVEALLRDIRNAWAEMLDQQVATASPERLMAAC